MRMNLSQFLSLHLRFPHTIALCLSCTAVGNVLNRGGVTGREPFYPPAGSHSDTWEKQQEGRGMEAEIVQTDWVHMRPGSLRENSRRVRGRAWTCGTGWVT